MINSSWELEIKDYKKKKKWDWTICSKIEKRREEQEEERKRQEEIENTDYDLDAIEILESKILEIIQHYYDLLTKENIYATFKTRHDISLDRYGQALEKYNSGALSKLNLLN